MVVAFSFISRSYKHEYKQTDHSCDCNPSFPTVRPSTSFRQAHTHRISMSIWFHKPYKWDTMGATDCVFLSRRLLPSLSLSLAFLLTVVCHVSWDRVARETRPQPGPLRQKSPNKKSTALLTSLDDSLTVQYRAGLTWEVLIYQSTLWKPNVV